MFQIIQYVIGANGYGIDYKQYGQIRIQSLLALQKGRETLAKLHPKIQSLCPICGNPKHKQSKTCRQCYYKIRLKQENFIYNKTVITETKQ